MESSKASAATDIKLRPLREDKTNFYPWMMELKEALRGRGLLGALFPDDREAAKIMELEKAAAGDSSTAKAKLELKRMNEKNTVVYILKNNVAPGIKSTLPYGGDPEEIWKLLVPHRELFTLHSIDYRLMNLRLKDFSTGLDLINEAIRLYRPVEQSDEWKEALPEKTVVGRLTNLFSTYAYLRFKEYLMVENRQIGLKVDTLAELRERYITFHVLIHGSQNGTQGQRTQQEVSYYTGGTPRDKKNVECYGCGRKGHYKRDCRRKNEWESYALKKRGEKASAANPTKESPEPPQPPDDSKKNKRRQKRLLNKKQAKEEELHFAFAARQTPWEKSVEFFEAMSNIDDSNDKDLPPRGISGNAERTRGNKNNEENRCHSSH